jgi:hypothetical protein
VIVNTAVCGIVTCEVQPLVVCYVSNKSEYQSKLLPYADNTSEVFYSIHGLQHVHFENKMLGKEIQKI